MDVIAFYDTILPSQGLRCLTRARTHPKWPHTWYTSNAALAQDVARYDGQGETVYFALASYAPHPGERDPRRDGAHALFMRAFIVDLDVGPNDPTKYRTQRLAAEAILAFARKIGLPVPWLVKSGGGVHVYWPMTADMAIDIWKPIATALKRAMRDHGVLFDPKRTADTATILRPLGSTHRKDPNNPRVVTLQLQGDVVDLPTFLAPLASLVTLAAPASTGAVITNGPNAALGGGMGYDPSSAIKMANECGVVGLVRDTKGKVDQPTWYNVLGVLRHTVEAPAICHDWSTGDPRYTAAETDAKLAQLASFNATSCEVLEDSQPDICAACAYKGKIKSPIQLGRAHSIAPVAPHMQTSSGGAGQGSGGGGAFGGGTTAGGAAPSGGSPSDMPDGFSFKLVKGRKVLLHWVPPEGDVAGYWRMFCDTFFKAVAHYDVSGQRHYEWVIDPDGPEERSFTLDGGVLGKGGRDVLAVLGTYGVHALDGMKRVMETYLNRWISRIKEEPVDIAHRGFGWSRKMFVTGDYAISADGTLTKALMIGPAADKQAALQTKGDLATWVDMVDRAYNAPGQESFQFQLLCGFAAPLICLLDQVKGVTVYAHSSGSGVGKTTVQRVALSIWGFWDEMMLAHGKTTHAALWGLLGAYNTLPVVYDELTNAKSEDVSDLLFSVSSGRAKERMTAHGTLQNNNSSWSTILLASGNLLLSGKLGAHRSNADAEMSRMFEFTQDAEPHLSVEEANKLFPLINDHYGVAGEKYATYLATHRTAIVAQLKTMQATVVEQYGILQVDRNWSALFTCVLMALALTRHLGLLGFEAKPLKAWMAKRLDENRLQKIATIIPDEDKIGLMINDLRPRFLVTTGEGNRRTKQFAPIVNDSDRNREAFSGRLILGTANEPGQLWLITAEARRWCQANGSNYDDVFRTAVSRGWARPGDNHQINLHYGTAMPTSASYVRCWRMNTDAMPGADMGLTLLQGGLGSLAGTGTP